MFTVLRPYVSIIPLVFVLVVSAGREGYEDYKRFRSDKQVNNRRFQRMEATAGTQYSLVTVKSKALRVGDLVYLRKDEYVPADLVVLKSARPDGLVFVETSQLDGETNLKTHVAVAATHALDEGALLGLKGALQCEVPNKHFSFKGALALANGQPRIPLEYRNLIVRGAQLRNTAWTIGALAYAGDDTKLVHNQNPPPSKFSQLDRRLNKLVIAVFAFNFMLLIALTALAYTFEVRLSTRDEWYLGRDPSLKPVVVAVAAFFQYFALLSYLIPQSMMVTLEIVKVLQGQFMEWDENMATDPRHPHLTGMQVKTADLNDELGRVQYIFSDKTGTLTENRMVFSLCSVGGHLCEQPSRDLGVLAQGGGAAAVAANDFLESMSTCHTVQPEEGERGELTYSAQSPDEEALCKAAKDLGWELRGRVGDTVTVRHHGRDAPYHVVATNEFTNDRARMSIVLRLASGAFRLYCKGADSVIFQRLSAERNDAALMKLTHEHLGYFSKKGLRTLAFAYRDFTAAEWAPLAQQYARAAASMANRDGELRAVAEAMERDMLLLGCTAVEDKLQEKVPETIDYLLKAGVRIWVITGDKKETAENIGYSCRLLTSEMVVWSITADSSAACLEQLQSHLRAYNDQHRGANRKCALIITGAALKYALEEFPEQLLDLANVCHSMVCCRVTPLQKAEIVTLVRERLGAICLAIGDGANDVAMIQAAHVGVGIFGREGSQAARSADYALRRFSHLERLLTVHGRYAQLRNSFLIQFSMYKGAAIFLALVWYAIYSGYSAQVLFDPYKMTVFNILVTSLPPLLAGLFERDIPEYLIRRYPQVYQRVQSGYLFSYWSLALWGGLALYHSVVFFFGALLVMRNDALSSRGHTFDLLQYGNLVLTAGVVTILLKFVLETNFFTIFHVFAVPASFFGLFTVWIAESILPLNIFRPEAGTLGEALGTAAFWFWCLLAPGLCLLPDFLYKCIRRYFFPEDWQILQEQERLDTQLIPEYKFERAKTVRYNRKTVSVPLTDVSAAAGVPYTQLT